MSRSAVVLCLAALVPAFAAKPVPPVRPYGLSPELDLPLAAGIYSLKLNSDAMLADTRADHPWNPALRASSIPAFDRWAIGNYSEEVSRMSSVVAAAEFAIPVAADLVDGWRGAASWGTLAVDAIVLEEALTLSGALSSYAKSMRVHSTPIAYDPNVPESEKRLPQNASSFFSNHTASAFTTAVFSAYTFQLRHPDSQWVPWVWGGGLALATGVGSMRIVAGKHFPSDVAAGAAAGALCGYLIPRLHKGRAWNFGISAPQGTDAVGPALSRHF